MEQDTAKILGNNMQILRKIHGIEVREMCKYLNCCSRQTYSNYEKGITKMPFDAFISLCELFNISTQDILREDLKIIVNTKDNSILYD